MARPEWGRFEGSRRALLLAATDRACRLSPRSVSRFERATLAYYVMKQLHQGVFDLDVLANSALQLAAQNPYVLRDCVKVSPDDLMKEIRSTIADLQRLIATG